MSKDGRKVLCLRCGLLTERAHVLDTLGDRGGYGVCPCGGRFTRLPAPEMPGRRKARADDFRRTGE